MEKAPQLEKTNTCCEICGFCSHTTEQHEELKKLDPKLEAFERFWQQYKQRMKYANANQ